MTTKVAIVDWKLKQKELLYIREEVFIKEQKVPPSLEVDGQDSHYLHALLTVNSQAVSCARMDQEGHIGRVATLKPFRGQGFGEKIMISLEKQAKKMGLNTLYLNAQISAIPFYKKLQYEEYGDIFLDAGIKHIKMKKKL